MAKLLIIDDDPYVHDLVDLHLGGYVVDSIIHAMSAAEGLRQAAIAQPDVILLDMSMPHVAGLEVCQLLKSNETTRAIPVVFLTGDGSVHSLARALELGASDYVTKPFHAVELRARVTAVLRTKQLIDAVREDGRVDPLTGIQNRRGFEEAWTSVVSDYERNGRPFALMMLDLDHFKVINDTHGHGVGDDVLCRVGEVLRRTCRPYDTACRYGGEEFAVLLRGAAAEAIQAGRRIHESIRQLTVQNNGRTLAITASAGLVCSPTGGTTTDLEYIREVADMALYDAKRRGRDCLVVADAETATRTSLSSRTLDPSTAEPA